MTSIIEILMLVLLFFTLLLVGGIFYALRKGLNQVIEGLESLDERLADLRGPRGS